MSELPLTGLRVIDCATGLAGPRIATSPGAYGRAAAHPRLVLVRCSAFGQTGPYARRPAFATLAEAMSGLASITGEPGGPPLLPPIALADEVAGLVGTWATLAALYWRDARGGRGQV